MGKTLHTVGQIFVQFLKALVPPLVFTAIVASIAALRDQENAAKLVVQTLLWFAFTALTAAIAIGALAVGTGEGGAGFLAFNASALIVFSRLLRWGIALTPIGMAALIGEAVIRYG